MNCILAEEDEAETWGEALEQVEEQLERLRRNNPPEEMREYVEARRVWWELALEFMKSMDSDEQVDTEALSAFIRSTEMRSASAVVREVVDKIVDPDLANALRDAGC